MAKIRLFVEEKNLGVEEKIKISDADFEYLTKVMRQKIGDKISLFDGLNGELEATISQIEKKFLIAEITTKISDLKKVPTSLWLLRQSKMCELILLQQKPPSLELQSFNRF